MGAGNAREQRLQEPSRSAHHPLRASPPTGRSTIRDSECSRALPSAGGRESISLPASPGGRLGKSLPSLTPCSVAIPYYILHQKNRQINLNACSRTPGPLMSDTFHPGLNLHRPRHLGALQLLTSMNQGCVRGQLGDLQCWDRQKPHLFFGFLPSLLPFLLPPVL